MATNGLFVRFGPFFSGGSLATSAKIYHYVTGTTTDKDVYTDRAKTTTAAQPLVADSNGVATCYADGIYRIVVKTSDDTTLYTWDNVNITELDTVGEGAALTSAATLTLGTDGNYFHVSGSTGPITAISGTQAVVYLTFDSTPTLTHSGNLILHDSRDFIAAAGDVLGFVNDGSGVWRECSRRLATGINASQIADENKNELVKFTTTTSAVNEFTVANAATGNGPVLSATGGDTNISPIIKSKGTGEVVQQDASGVSVGWAPRSYLAGLTLSTAGSSATMSIAAGMCRDGTNVCNIVVAAIAKTTSAWAVGNAQGGLDTGAIANSTWYHFWAIRRSDTGVTDVLISLSATAPTMPTNYDYKRRIGAGKTDGSAQWILFRQLGDEFLWDATLEDVDAIPNSADAQTVTMTVPTGVKVWVLFRGGLNDATTNNRRVLFTSPDESDQAPSNSALPGISLDSHTAGNTGAAPFRIRTNTSGQIRYRMDAADADLRVWAWTYGWIDRRGRDD